jgi:hypothetical protein
MNPDLKQLISEYKLCSPTAGANWNRLQVNDDVRFNRWPNKFADGKKHNTTSKDAFPWEGAEDGSHPVADELVNWQVAECFDGFWRAWITPKAGTSETRNYAVKLVDYLVNTLLTKELYTEVQLSSQYRQHYGWCLLHPCWEFELSLEYREIGLADLTASAQQAREQLSQMPPGALSQEMMENIAEMLNLPALLVDPSLEERAADALAKIYDHYARQQMNVELEVKVPAIRRARLLQAVRDLRDKAVAEMPVPYVCKNQPAIHALKPWDEAFIAGNATDTQRCTVFRRVYMKEWELKAKANNGWDPKWIEEALKHKGKASYWSGGVQQQPSLTIQNAITATESAAEWAMQENHTDEIEVVYATYKMLDEDNVPGVYTTVFHPEVDGMNAEHGLLGWGGGQIPYVASCRERWHRAIPTSRGIPEIVVGKQRTIKVTNDATLDNMSISVLPPLNEYQTTMGTKYILGPAVRNQVMMGKEPRFMEVPTKGLPFNFELLAEVRRELDLYVGRDNPLAPPGLGQSKRQMSVSTFTMDWTCALQMAVDLCQTYMEDAQFAEITGAPAGWLDGNRKRRNLLSARLEMDIRELNPEYVAAQLQAVNQAVLPQDVAGVTNRSKWTKIQWRMINPMLARELVQDETEASQGLYNQVQNDIALMFLGNEPKYVEMDPTANQKLKYAAQIVSANPNYQQALQQQGRFSELMQKYSMNLQFSLTQEQNKQVGAIGVKPSSPQPDALPEA